MLCPIILISEPQSLLPQHSAVGNAQLTSNIWSVSLLRDNKRTVQLLLGWTDRSNFYIQFGSTWMAAET